MNIVNSCCIEYLRNCDPCSVIFADPPDNIGLGYKGHEDSMNELEYRSFCRSFIIWSMQKAARGLWISFNSRHLLMFADIINNCGGLNWTVTPCVQVITFGNQRTKPGKLTNNHRPLWYISWGEPNFNDVREPSWRQLNGDKRADARGKLVSDVFNFPRVTGNSKQRRKWHPTQLNEDLVQRCLELTTCEGDTVVDIFAGTGTTGRVCQKLGLSCTLVEKSDEYYRELKREFGQSEAEQAIESLVPSVGCSDNESGGQE